MSRATIIILIALLVASSALYDRFSAVKSLTTGDFNQVKKGIWLVEFFAPWCGHCKNLAPEYEKAAKALKGIANIAAVDATVEKVDVQVQGYPTLKFYVDGTSTDYDGPRTSDGIIDFILRKYRNVYLWLCRLRMRDWEEDRPEVARAVKILALLDSMSETWSCSPIKISKTTFMEMKVPGMSNFMRHGADTVKPSPHNGRNLLPTSKDRLK
jgi:protein disulfide-isomerase-like protein